MGEVDWSPSERSGSAEVEPCAELSAFVGVPSFPSTAARRFSSCAPCSCHDQKEFGPNAQWPSACRDCRSAPLYRSAPVQRLRGRPTLCVRRYPQFPKGEDRRRTAKLALAALCGPSILIISMTEIRTRTRFAWIDLSSCQSVTIRRFGLHTLSHLCSSSSPCRRSGRSSALCFPSLTRQAACSCSSVDKVRYSGELASCEVALAFCA